MTEYAMKQICKTKEMKHTPHISLGFQTEEARNIKG
jgi:hypothetical protein